MTDLIQKTVEIFKVRNQLNIKDGFHQEENVFNKILLELVAKKLDDSEGALFRNCRKIIEEGLDYGRANQLELAFEQFKKLEDIICSETISYQCKLLIAVFYSSGLAYLRLKEGQREEAEALSLQALSIGNYLVQEYGYHILDMHRVWQIANLVRIQLKIDKKDEAFRMLFALLRCFENRAGFPAAFHFNPLEFLKTKYAATPIIPKTIGANNLFSQLDSMYQLPITRYGGNTGGYTEAMQNCFLFDFSSMSFELIEGMFDDMVINFVHFTKGFNHVQIKSILNTNGIHSISDLKYFKLYPSAYLFLKLKIYIVNGQDQKFLNLLKVFCEKAAFKPIWNAIMQDFYGFCMHSGEVSADLKEQVYKMLDSSNKCKSLTL